MSVFVWCACACVILFPQGANILPPTEVFVCCVTPTSNITLCDCVCVYMCMCCEHVLTCMCYLKQLIPPSLRCLIVVVTLSSGITLYVTACVCVCVCVYMCMCCEHVLMSFYPIEC